MTAQVRRIEDDIFVENKSEGESDAKRHTQGSIVCFKRNKSQIEQLLVKDIIETNVKKENVQHRIRPAANGIPESL